MIEDIVQNILEQLPCIQLIYGVIWCKRLFQDFTWNIYSTRNYENTVFTSRKERR